jgi:hypothetical protein
LLPRARAPRPSSTWTPTAGRRRRPAWTCARASRRTSTSSRSTEPCGRARRHHRPPRDGVGLRAGRAARARVGAAAPFKRHRAPDPAEPRPKRRPSSSSGGARTPASSRSPSSGQWSDGAREFAPRRYCSGAAHRAVSFVLYGYPRVLQLALRQFRNSSPDPKIPIDLRHFV